MPRPPSPDGYPTMCLALLASGPAHGYDLVQRMAERTGDEILLPAGLVYAILHGLERDGLAEASWDPGPGARRRRIYRLTDRGRRVLEDREAAPGPLVVVDVRRRLVLVFLVVLRAAALPFVVLLVLRHVLILAERRECAWRVEPSRASRRPRPHPAVPRRSGRPRPDRAAPRRSGQAGSRRSGRAGSRRG